MGYRIFSISSGEFLSGNEAHVLARAYRAAWRATYGAEPEGRHQFAALDLVIDFGGSASGRVAISHREPALAIRWFEPEPVAVGGRDDT